MIRQLNELRQLKTDLASEVRGHKTLELARHQSAMQMEDQEHKKRMDEILQVEQELGLVHDCSQGGTRRVYKVRNCRDAIHAVLPINEDRAITAGQVHAAMKTQGFTYAYITVVINLQKMESGNYMDENGKIWIIGNEGSNHGETYHCRRQYYQFRAR